MYILLKSYPDSENCRAEVKILYVGSKDQCEELLKTEQEKVIQYQEKYNKAKDIYWKIQDKSEEEQKDYNLRLQLNSIVHDNPELFVIKEMLEKLELEANKKREENISFLLKEEKELFDWYNNKTSSDDGSCTKFEILTAGDIHKCLF